MVKKLSKPGGTNTIINHYRLYSSLDYVPPKAYAQRQAAIGAIKPAVTLPVGKT